MSGIEHAQFYRWQVFNDLKIESRIVTFDYTPELNRFLFRHSIDRDASLNMFDFWQSALNGTIRDYPFVNEFADLKTEFEYYGQRTTPDYDLGKNKIRLVRYFNSDGQLVIEDHWDIRGFLSLRLEFNGKNVEKRSWFNPVRKVVLYEVGGLLIVTSDNPQYVAGKKNVYVNWREIKAAWLDYLASQDNEAVLYIDRAEYATPIVLTMQNKFVPTYIVLHSAHTRDRNDPLNSPLNDVRKLEFDHRERWQGYIAATPQQAKDYTDRTGIKTFSIPVAQVKQEKLTLSVKPKGARNLIYASRISREKRIQDAIYAVAKLASKYPDIRLHVYGYVTDSQYNNELLALIKQLKVEKNVFLLPYQENKDQLFANADIFVLTSKYEGFNMSMLEAAAHGIPTVAYDVKYGPAYIHEKLESGVMVESGNIEALSEGIASLLDNSTEFNRQRKLGQERAIEVFGMHAITKKWKRFLESENLLENTHSY
jgi:Glycosyltransferase